MKPLSKTPTDFLQVTRGYLRDMRELAKRSPAAHQVLWLLAERMNKTNAVVISQKTMGQILGYSRSTLNRAINLLREERWVQVIATGGSNAYVVNSKVLWRDQGGKRYAAFFAEVVVSADEQAHPVEEWDNVELRHMPILRGKEVPLTGDEALPPPDQQDLLPADRLEFPRARVDQEKGEIHELEARGQKRLLD
jgi:DNA-binding transcriptional MocR family regulator